MNPLDVVSQLFGANVAGPADWLWAMEETARGRYFARQRSEASRVASASVNVRVQAGGSVAVIPVHGVMVKQAQWEDEASTVGVTRAVQAAAADPQVAAIVLDMETPGGSVSGLEELGEAIDRAAESKRVVAQSSGMICSAGYEIACHASAIYARRDHVIGSIGTRLHVFDWSQLFANLGVESIPIDTGEFKSAGAFGTKLTDNQRAYLQDLVDSFQSNFSASVEAGRGLTGERLAAVANGRVWTGEQAVALGLIDAVQSMETTLQQLAADAPASTPRSSTMSQATEPAAPAASNEPQAATLGELKACCPGADSDFLLEQIERGATKEQAMTAHMAALQAANAEALQAKADAEAEAAEAKKSQGEPAEPAAPPKKRGNAAPVATAEQADGGEADYRAMALERMNATDCTYREACSWVKRQHPEAREFFKTAKTFD